MSTSARLKHEAGLSERQARDESDTHDLLMAHCGGYIDLRLPTPYPPGTREKRAVMCARYRIGTAMFVDGDQLDWGRWPCPST